MIRQAVLLLNGDIFDPLELCSVVLRHRKKQLRALSQHTLPGKPEHFWCRYSRLKTTILN